MLLTLAQVKDTQRERRGCKRKEPLPRGQGPEGQGSEGKTTRQVPFVPGACYQLIREGIALGDMHPEVAYSKGELTEAHLWHFCHTDAAAVRSGDKGTTRYAAALQWRGGYIRPQHKYLQMCYKDRKRSDAAPSSSMMEAMVEADGTPWWTDAYLVNQLESIRAKERYKLAKKQKKA